MKKFLPLILLLVVSCSDSATDPRSDPRGIIVTGRVVDGVTGQPMKGQTVSIERRVSTGLLDYTREERVDEAPSASDGSFAFTVAGANGTSYFVKAESDATIAYSDFYTSPRFLDDRINLAPGENLNLELQLQPTARIVVRPQTDQPLGAGDQFVLSISSAAGGSQVNMRDQPKQTSQMIAGETVSVTWTVTRGGVREVRSVEGLIQRHALMEYTAEY